jgi:hypothetical protein
VGGNVLIPTVPLLTAKNGTSFHILILYLPQSMFLGEVMGKKKGKRKINTKKKAGSSPSPLPEDAGPAAANLSTVSVEATDNEVEVATEAESEVKVIEVKENVNATTGTAQEVKEEASAPESSGKQSKGRFAWLTAPIGSAFKRANPLPSPLEGSLSLFTPSQQELAKRLCDLPGTTNQRHLFENWSMDPECDERKKALMSKLEMVDQSYPDGGLIGYLNNAVFLLEKSRKGENLLEGWVPSVPKGESFVVGTNAFIDTEKLGLDEVGKCGFVLVAGGLGERLGYGDIKVSCVWGDGSFLNGV